LGAVVHAQVEVVAFGDEADDEDGIAELEEM